MAKVKAKTLEQRVAHIVRSRFGGAAAMHRQERAARLLEEALELAQAESIPTSFATNLLNNVYSRAPGDSVQEAGGVAVTLLAWCASVGHSLRNVTMKEILRIEAKSARAFQTRIAEKQSVGTLLHTRPCPRCPDRFLDLQGMCPECRFGEPAQHG